MANNALFKIGPRSDLWYCSLDSAITTNVDQNWDRVSGTGVQTGRQRMTLIHRMQINSRILREGRGINQHRRLTPLVRSNTWSGTKKSLGLTSSLKLPTALNATTHLTPNFLSAAILALDGTSCGAISWCRPCLERTATLRGVPEGLGCERMVMGDEGVPHGVESIGCVSGRQATGPKSVR